MRLAIIAVVASIATIILFSALALSVEHDIEKADRALISRFAPTRR